jgi:serpin B
MKKILLCLLTACECLCALPQEQLSELSKEISEFALSSYAALPPSSNRIFSPYSLFAALSMIYVGAREETADELQKALFLKFSQNKIGPLLANLQNTFTQTQKQPDYELHFATGLWVDQDTYILSDFLHVAEEDYDAKVDDLDFHDSVKAMQIINEWVMNQTRGKIPHLLNSTDLSGSTRMLLTNAVYFKGSWLKPFGTKSTQKASFRTALDNTSDVSMMEQTSFFPYFENDFFQLLALPFVDKGRQNESLACLVFLPKIDIDLAEVEQSLTPAVYQVALSQLKNEWIKVKLPRFALTLRLDLNDTLQKLGICQAFSQGANFSGINGMRDLFLSKVVHEAFFSLDEAGVTAAAATGAAINVTSTLEKKAPLPFTADHPFLFFIADLKSKTPLFMGRLVDPKLLRAADVTE